MITIIAGEKGSGKTKKIIDLANKESSGVNVVLATTDRYRSEIKPEVRFVDTVEEGVHNFDRLVGFIKGVLCTNYDIENLFIDGAYKMIGSAIDSAEMAELIAALDAIGKSSQVNFVLTVSCATDKLPEFIKKYL